MPYSLSAVRSFSSIIFSHNTEYLTILYYIYQKLVNGVAGDVGLSCPVPSLVQKAGPPPLQPGQSGVQLHTEGQESADWLGREPAVHTGISWLAGWKPHNWRK